MQQCTMISSAPTLGLLAGSGHLPLQIAQACRDQQRPLFVLGFENTTDMTPYADLPHACVRLGAIGEAIAHLRNAGVQNIVMAGSIKRPSWSSLRPDAMGTKLMARLGARLFSGDDALLKAVLQFLEEEGFHVVASETIVDDLRMPPGVLGRIAPDAQAERDVVLGMEAAQTLGKLDIGQAVIVEHGYVLGVEAAEGTQALVARCASLKREGNGQGVLVKCAKPGQEQRTDLPSIGLQTVRDVHAAGLAGIALSAGGIIINKPQTIAEADTLGIFLLGCD